MSFESRSFSNPGTQVTNIWSASTPFPGSTSSIQLTLESGNMARTSTTTPGYALKAMTGNLPENSFGFSETRETAKIGVLETSSWLSFLGPGNKNFGRKTGIIQTSGAFPAPPVFLALESIYESQVRAKLMDQVLDTDFDTSVFAGEFRETCEMFHDFAHRLVNALKGARRGDLKEVLIALSLKGDNAWSNLWLTITYGIRPFVADIQGAVKALEKGLTKEGYYVVHAGTLYEDTIVTSVGSPTGSNGQLVTTWTKKIQVGGRVKYTVTDPYHSSLSSLGLTNPLNVAWELTKLSFVVDWAIGVGSWLGQLGATFGKSFFGGSVTTFTKLRGVQEFTKHYKDFSFVSQTEDTYWTAVKETTTCNRIGLVSWPVNYLPAFKDPRGLSHLASAISLLKQRW
jgi:hypothetical protein